MTFIILIILAVFLFALNSRVGRLEAIVKELRAGGVVAPEHSVPVFTSTPVQMPDTARVEGQPAAPVSMPTFHSPQGGGFMAWAKEDWLLKLGAFVLLLGFAWFLLAVGLVLGELGRVTLGLIIGAGILFFGWIRMAKFVRQGSIFLVLGSIVIILASFTATYGYNLFPSEISLFIMFMSSMFVALASVRYRLLPLAFTSLMLASFAPTLLLTSVVPQYVELFVYLFVVTLGVLWVVALTGWRVLTLAALVTFVLYSLPHFGLFSAGAQEAVLLWCAYAFTLLFFIVNTAGILKSQDKDINSDVIAAGINGLLLLAWVVTHVASEWKTLVIVGWMLLFIVVAFVVFSITKRREPFFVYAGVGVVMLAAATATTLDGAPLTIAYIIEGALLPIVAYLITRDRSVSELLSLLMIGPALLSSASIVVNWSSHIPWDHFFILFLMSGALLILGIFFMLIPRNEKETSLKDIPSVHLIVGSVFAYILIWLSFHAIMTETSAIMVSLSIYSVIGFIAYAYGNRNEQKLISRYGTVLLTFVAGHLIIIESFKDGNILIFFLVGAVLVATAFIGRKKK
ncbi:MAG: DUF2339 domain-containing protein [Patescibacteria group bacterium]